MPHRNLIIGSNGHVCAIDPESGSEIWRTRLQEGFFKATNHQDVSVIVKDGIVFAGSQGHLFAIEAESGRILWQNSLKGLGYNDIALAFGGQSVQFIQKVERSHSSSSGQN